MKFLSFPLHTRAPLAWGLNLQTRTDHSNPDCCEGNNENIVKPHLLPRLKKKKKKGKDAFVFSFSPTPQLLLQHPYLLFDLLQRRLLNGTLHLLLLDGLHHLPRKKRPLVSRREGQSQITGLFVSSVLTGNFRGPYLASCRAEGDLKGVGVQGDDSMMERRMFGVLNLAEEN